MRKNIRQFLVSKLKESKENKQIQSDNKIISAWENSGRPVPPPSIVKRNVIADFQKKYKYQIFVETGTFLGDTVEAQRTNFKKVYSIELGEDLYKNAVKRFEDHSNVTILRGDSGVVLQDLIKKLDSPGIFWLDGHYSAGITARGEKECPVFEELNAIFTSQLNHILLIDDARLFIDKDDYPSIKQLSEFILSNRPNSKIEIKDDIIRVICA